MHSKKNHLSLKKGLLIIILGFTGLTSLAQPLSGKIQFTRQDTLRGSITPERSWWDVRHYDITVDADLEHQTISGVNIIKFATTAPGQRLQLDLQQPMNIVEAKMNGINIPFERDGNVYFLNFPEALADGKTYSLEVKFSGKPRKATNPPWDRGWIWKKDKE